MLPMRCILHPTDFSAPAAFAFQVACSLARDHEANLVITHVASPAEVLLYKKIVGRVQPREYYQEIGDKLRQLKAPDKVTLDYRLDEGDPAKEIIRVARETKCGLIVLGTHGRTGLGRLLMGSVAEQVVRLAPCPVLTVKALLQEPVPAPAEQPPEGVQS